MIINMYSTIIIIIIIIIITQECLIVIQFVTRSL